MYCIKAVSNTDIGYWNDTDNTTTPYLAMATKYDDWRIADKRCEELNQEYSLNPCLYFHRKKVTV